MDDRAFVAGQMAAVPEAFSDGVVQRLWDFIETQLCSGAGDGDLETLLQIECFEGVGWVEDLSEYLGPRTRELLRDAQRWLAPYNDQIGRWAGKRRR